MMRAPVRPDLERARRQAWLIRERVLRGKHILLEARVHFRSVRQHALQQRRSDRQNLQARPLHNRNRTIQLLIAQIDDVLPKHHP